VAHTRILLRGWAFNLRSAVNSMTIRAPKAERVGVVLVFVVSAVGWMPGFRAIAWAQQVGSITQFSGSAQLHRAGAVQNPAVGTVVDLHDQLSTLANSSATVTLADKSTLSLSQMTTLTFDENVISGGTRQRTLVGLLSGAVSSVITTAMSGGNPTFQINTPNAQVGVRGTNFVTTYSEGKARPGYEGCQRYTDVIVHEGTVVVTNRSKPGQVVDVAGGFETTVPCLLPPLIAGPIGLGGGSSSPPAAGVPPPSGHAPIVIKQ